LGGAFRDRRSSSNQSRSPRRHKSRTCLRVGVYDLSKVTTPEPDHRHRRVWNNGHRQPGRSSPLNERLDARSAAHQITILPFHGTARGADGSFIIPSQLPRNGSATTFGRTLGSIAAPPPLPAVADKDSLWVMLFAPKVLVSIIQPLPREIAMNVAVIRLGHREESPLLATFRRVLSAPRGFRSSFHKVRMVVPIAPSMMAMRLSRILSRVC